jgi:hypothetical protein
MRRPRGWRRRWEEGGDDRRVAQPLPACIIRFPEARAPPVARWGPTPVVRSASRGLDPVFDFLRRLPHFWRTSLPLHAARCSCAPGQTCIDGVRLPFLARGRRKGFQGPLRRHDQHCRRDLPAPEIRSQGARTGTYCSVVGQVYYKSLETGSNFIPNPSFRPLRRRLSRPTDLGPRN